MTTRRWMIAVAGIAFVLGGERLLFLHAAGMASSGPNGVYNWDEAMGTWVLVNFLVGAIVAIIAMSGRKG